MLLNRLLTAFSKQILRRFSMCWICNLLITPCNVSTKLFCWKQLFYPFLPLKNTFVQWLIQINCISVLKVELSFSMKTRKWLLWHLFYSKILQLKFLLLMFTMLFWATHSKKHWFYSIFPIFYLRQLCVQW